jgi:DNA-binding beta-propeller fold protein YncE
MSRLKLLLPGLLCGVAAIATAQVLTPLGRFNSGAGSTGAEIPALDTATQRLFVINGKYNRVDVASTTDLTKLSLTDSVRLASYGGFPNSVAVHNGLVAVAIEDSIKQNSGKVVFLQGNPLQVVKSVTVGALPDMLTFSKDGSRVFVANEGEPNDAYTNNPEGSVSIIDLGAGVTNATVRNVSFAAYNDSTAALLSRGVILDSPAKLGLSIAEPTVAQNIEPEYIAVSEDGSKIWVTLQENNALAIIDVASGTISNIVALGTKDHRLPENALDANKDDAKAALANWNLRGLYMPDAIHAFAAGGKNYVITANEGDAREYKTANVLTETTVDALIKAGKLGPNALDSAAKVTLKSLKVHAIAGQDANGKVDTLHTFGARSFTIWDDKGVKVWDSGDLLERITSQAYPTQFNSQGDFTKTQIDNRSNAKGPEPEGVAIGKIGNQTLAFIGLERMGGIMAFDVSQPQNPIFLQYLNTGNVKHFGAPADISPEGLQFVPASAKTGNKNLLIASYEVSGTTVVFEVKAPANGSMKVELSPTLKTIGNNLKLYTADTVPTLSTTLIREGGFSDLVKEPGSTDIYWTINDRGVNVAHEPTGKNFKVFYSPEYNQKLIRFRALGNDSLEILKIDSIKASNGRFTTGLPNPMFPTSEVALRGRQDGVIDTTSANVIATDSAGFDFEGLTIDANGHFWFSDEYGPFIGRINKTSLQIDSLFYPGKGLSQAMATRRANRGMEGLTVTANGKLMGVMQSPMENAVGEVGRNVRQAPLIRMVHLDPATGTSKEYAYIPDLKGGTRKAGDVKMGAITALNDSTFIVVEHGEDAAKKYWTDLYRVTITGATDIAGPGVNGKLWTGSNWTAEQYALKDFKGFSAAVVPVRKELLVTDINAKYLWAPDKTEGLALINDTTFALVNDNDYGMQEYSVNGVTDGIPHLKPLATRQTQFITINPNKDLRRWVMVDSIPAGNVITANQAPKTIDQFSVQWLSKGELLVQSSKQGDLEVGVFDGAGRWVSQWNQPVIQGAARLQMPQVQGAFFVMVRQGDQTLRLRIQQ